MEDLTEKEYRSYHAISNSDLSLLKKHPRYFYDCKILEKPNPIFSDGFKMGKLIDIAVLETARIGAEYAFLPESIVFPNSNTKEYIFVTEGMMKGHGINESYAIAGYATGKNDREKAKELWEKHIALRQFLAMNEGKEIITYEEMLVAKRAVNSLKHNPSSYNLLFKEINPAFSNVEAFNQLKLYFVYNEIECKAMLDRVIIDEANKTASIIDLKTTRKDINEFSYYARIYGYHRQLYFYRQAVRTYIQSRFTLQDQKLNEWSFPCYIVAVETQEPNTTRVFKLSENVLLGGKREIEDLIRRYIWHRKENKWDYTMEEYTDGHQELDFWIP